MKKKKRRERRVRYQAAKELALAPPGHFPEENDGVWAPGLEGGSEEDGLWAPGVEGCPQDDGVWVMPLQSSIGLARLGAERVVGPNPLSRSASLRSISIGFDGVTEVTRQYYGCGGNGTSRAGS